MEVELPPQLTTVIHKAESQSHIAYYYEDDCFVNLAGEYDYLELPYYISQDYETSGKNIYPTCKQMLDAYVTPIFLEKARAAGLPVPEWYITNGFFEPPVLVDPINPFMTRSRKVLKAGREASVARSMTRNFTYAMCCQELPPDSQVIYFRSVLGWCVSPRFREVSKEIWRVFRIPLARVRMVVLPRGGMLYSDISQLPFEKLHRREIEHIGRNVRWQE
jgi:hypothetical protein